VKRWSVEKRAFANSALRRGDRGIRKSQEAGRSRKRQTDAKRVERTGESRKGVARRRNRIEDEESAR
jgi:hypothetical protein